MENKNNSVQKNNNSFSNLKTLGVLLSGNELNSFVTAIGKAKRALDAYCKQLKEKEVASLNKQETENSGVASVQKVEQQAPIAAHKTFDRGQVQHAQVRKEFNNQGGRFASNANIQQSNGVNNRGDYKSRGNSAPNGSGAFNKSRNSDEKSRIPAPRTPNVSRPTMDKTPLFTKPERNFGNKNKSKVVETDKKELNKKAKIRMGYVAFDDFENEDRMGRVRSAKPKKQKENVVVEKQEIKEAVITTDNLTVKLLSEKIGKPAVEIIKKFMMLGMMPNINSVIDFQTAELVAQEFGVTLEQKVEKNYEEKLVDMFTNQDDSHNVKRPPIVTVMGHVDHGKTSLLDAIKKTNVTSGEAGGITQHIGAYSVEAKGNKITFIDTPGHEAFTSMRARGAMVTDVAILVVAADDGIMPQTVEAINHIKNAGVPMVVAINKMDKPTANPDKIKQQLTEYDVVPEEWGGDTICVPISALTGEGIDKLLEMVLLVSDMADLSADANLPGYGYVIESKIDKGRGVVATIIVKNGSLHVGDYMVCGVSSGRIRAMMDYKGNDVKTAGPSMAVSVLGFNNVPDAGEKAYVVDEKLAKNIVEERASKLAMQKANQNNNITLEDFLKQSADNEVKVLKIIVKADVKGSTEAVKQTLEKIQNEEVKAKVIHSAVGGINESDVLLAQASGAIIIGFNVRPEAKAKILAEHNGIDIKLYRVIYEAIDDVTMAINGMLAPKFEENTLGHAEIRQVFKLSSVGIVAGCYVTDGVINRNAKARLVRNNIVIVETEVDTIQQQKDEVKSIKSGFECGIKLKNYSDIKIGDIIETYELKQIN